MKNKYENTYINSVLLASKLPYKFSCWRIIKEKFNLIILTSSTNKKDKKNSNENIG